MLVVLLVGIVFFIGITLVRRSRHPWVRKCAKLAFVLSVSAPLYGLLMQIDHRTVRMFMLRLVSDEIIVRRLVFTIPLTVCLFTLLLALRRTDKAVRIASRVLLILAPFVVITFLQATVTAMKYRHVGEGAAAPPLAVKKQRSAPRVVWLVFDELDFRTAFAERPTTVKLPELDRLATQSLFAVNAYPPAGETFLSMPALITGKLVSAARRSAPDELMIKFGDDTEATPWSGQPNIFSRAREAGFNTALAGWYHPYCRILGENLTRCAWEGQILASESPGEGGEDTSLPITGATEGVIPRMYSHAYKMALTIPFASLVFPQRVDIGELERRKQVSDFNTIHRLAIEAASDPNLGVIMIHWPIPHAPNIYNRSQGRISAASNQSYLDNLALVDRTMADIRVALEDRGTWDDTVVLVTSDHWWRDSLWKKHKTWTAEDEEASKGELDRRVPFILKMPGSGDKGNEFLAPFNTVLTHDLILSILRGEVSDTKGAAEWLEHHRSIGRSPYDDRAFRDAQ
jgi:Sulfatase